MATIEYDRKPSITTLRAAVTRAVRNGETWIQLTWGENQITLERTKWGLWDGHGWIGKHGGHDMARVLNSAPELVLARARGGALY